MKATVHMKTCQFTRTQYSEFGPTGLGHNPKYCVLIGEAANTSFNVFILTRSGIEQITFHTRGENTHHYTTKAVKTI